tara:strand:- start:216 stop:452 length:237 start_codon:yes stop_codon:yes gene_type:complete
MDYEIMRLKCLEMAVAQGLKGDEARAEADRMIKFAREGSLLDKVYGADSISDPHFNLEETPTATVHRRPPFLDDYKPE